ncbi:tetratricopeptide repeat protein [Hyphobacterium sp. CCMP332]|nr:tetratricopeptide repeat protein [Hyphobacterium sp. CCMP332]
MKNLYQLFAFSLIVIITFSSCSKMRYVNMQSMRPAAFEVPSHIQSIVIVDRTEFEKEGINILEGVLTGELPGQDKAALQEGIYAMQSTFSRSPRFQIKVATQRLKGNSITAAFPKPIPWRSIRELNRQYETDAVLAIEIFDTDFVVTRGDRMVKKKVKEGENTVEKEVKEYYAEGIESVKIGFRLYDPKNNQIIDQAPYTRTNTWEATGSNINDAVANLISKNEAAKYVTKLAANAYVNKITPMPITIRRQFYSKSKKVNAIPAGSRMADVNRWEDAARTWSNAITIAPSKEAGYLAYNTAVAYEVLGDYDLAIQWAQDAWVKYGNKKARDYVNSLNYRISQEDRVDRQLNK